MTFIDLSQEPRSEMIEISFLISEVCLDEFGGCNFLKFG